MRCDEIQERFVDLLYNENGTPPASPELQAHINSCPACQKELEELKSVQRSLRSWEDEPPLRHVVLPRDEYALPKRHSWFVWSALRYAAVAVIVLIAFLSIASPEITWNSKGFSFKTNPPWGVPRSDYYTKAETRDIIKAVRDDSEAQMTETTRLMMERLLDTVDQERMMDLRLVRHETEQNRNKN